MPYVSCPSCELSVYAPRASFSTLHHCPRCDAVLGNGPRLFADLPRSLTERVRETRRWATEERARARHG